MKETGIIPGATVKNFFDSDFDSYVEKLDKSKNYIVYCKSGGRSGKALAKMKKQKLKVRDYQGGIMGWQAK